MMQLFITDNSYHSQKYYVVMDYYNYQQDWISFIEEAILVIPSQTLTKNI